MDSLILEKKLNKLKKELKYKLEELDLNNDSKLKRKIKKHYKEKINKIKKKIFKENQEKIKSSKKYNKLYLHKATKLFNNEKLKFWSNEEKQNEEFKIVKTILIDKKDTKFFKELFDRILNKEEYDLFINDEEYYKTINKLIKNYNNNNTYKIF